MYVIRDIMDRIYLIDTQHTHVMNDFLTHYNLMFLRGCPHGVMVKVLDCGIVVSKFELQSRYDVHSRTNTLGKGMNLLILPAMG